MPITASTPISGATFTAAAGRMGMAMRTKPYVPSLRSTAAKITEPTVGACVWASGNHVWNGNIGTLMPKPMNMPRKMSTCEDNATPWSAVGSARMSKVCGFARKNMAKKLRIISAEPKSVNRKNLSDA